MGEKLLNTRIALRIDTFENWAKTDDASKGANLVLKRGEIGFCEIPAQNPAAQTAPTVLFKVGDGTKKFSELNWASALAADVYAWAKASNVVLDGQVIKFMNGTEEVKRIDLSSFALDSDVNNAIARISALESKFTGTGSVQGQLDALDGRLDVIEGTGEGSVAKALADAKAYTNTREAAIKTAYEAYADQAEVDAKAHTDKAVDALEASIAAAEGKVTAEAQARAEADTAINNKIGTVTEGKTVVGMIADAQTAAEAKVTALANGQVTTNKNDIATIKNDYLKGADKQALESKITANTNKIGTDIDAAKTELKGSTGDASSAATIAGAKKYADEKAAAVQGNLNTLSGTVSTLSETVATNNATITEAVAKVEREYKAADSTLTTAINNEKTARENADTALQTEINNIKTNIASGLHFRGIVDKLENVNTPVEGDIAIVGTVEYIYDGSKWQEFGDAEAHAAKTYVDTELAKKVDKTVYDAAIEDLEAEDADIRADFAAADTELKTELEGKINLKANASDLNTAVGRIDAAEDAIDDLESTKLDASTYNTFVQNTYTTDKAALAADIKEVDDRLNDKGDIKVALDAAKAQADKGVADAAAAQADVDGIAALVGNGFSSGSTIAQQLAAVKQTADAAAVASEVDAAISALQGKDTAHETRMGKIETAATNLAERVTTAEGNITRIDGEIDGHDTKIAALEGKVDVAKVSTAISSAVATEKAAREAADADLDSRIGAYEARFGTADDLLVLNCGTSTTNI